MPIYELRNLVAELLNPDTANLEEDSVIVTFIRRYIPTLKLDAGSRDLLRGRTNRGGSASFELQLIDVFQKLHKLAAQTVEVGAPVEGKVLITSPVSLQLEASGLLDRDSPLLRGIRVGYDKYYDNAIKLMKTGAGEFNALPAHWKKIFIFAVAFFKINIAVANAQILGFDSRRPRLFEVITAILNNSLSQETIENICGEYVQLLKLKSAVAELRQVLESDGSQFTNADLQ